MKEHGFRSMGTMILLITAAVLAAVIFLMMGTDLVFPPSYSKPVENKVMEDTEGYTFVQEGRSITVFCEDETVWELPSDVLAQDYFVEDIDRDGRRDLVILCWKRGRYGKQRPTWVKSDEISWSQHIFVYNIRNDGITPKWMASDIGVHAASMEYFDDVLSITDTDGNLTRWMWVSWGFEKL